MALELLLAAMAHHSTPSSSRMLPHGSFFVELIVGVFLWNESYYEYTLTCCCCRHGSRLHCHSFSCLDGNSMHERKSIPFKAEAVRLEEDDHEPIKKGSVAFLLVTPHRRAGARRTFSYVDCTKEIADITSIVMQHFLLCGKCFLLCFFDPLSHPPPVLCALSSVN